MKKKANCRDIYNWRHESGAKKSAEARKSLPRKKITIADIVATREKIKEEQC